MKKSESVTKVLDILQKQYPEAHVTLDFQKPLQLLVATILAAQSTDQRVNLVTRDLFKKYRTAGDFAKADLRRFEEEIRSTGFYHNKAKNVIACCREIVNRFHGDVPANLEDLVTLPGVGRKTANVVLGNAFAQQAIAVDTHVKRVTHRPGWAKSDNPDKIEFELMEAVPGNRWTRACHLLVFHGRSICIAPKPKCSVCPVAAYCPKIGVTMRG